MIRLGIIALVGVAITYGHNLKDLRRLEPLFRPANVLKGVRGGNYAVDGSPGGAKVEAREDESSSGTDDERRRDFENEKVIIVDPTAECDAYIPVEIEEAYIKRNRTTLGSAVTKNEEQSNDNHTINHLVTIVERTFVERQNETIGQVDNGNDSEKKVEVLRECIGIPVNPHFILTVTNCCTQCLPISQRQAEKGKKERNFELRRRPRDDNKRRQKIQKHIAQFINPEVKDTAILPGLFKTSKNSIFEVDILPKALRLRSVYIPLECVERMSSSREDYPVECPVLMELVRPLSPETVMPICLPINKTFDILTEMIFSMGLGEKQGWQKEPNIVVDIYPLDSFKCSRLPGSEKIPKDIFRTQAIVPFSGGAGASLVIYTPPKRSDYRGKMTLVALLVQSLVKGKSEELPGSEENDEGKNLGKTEMEDKGSREAVRRQEVQMWLKLDCYITWIVETAFGISPSTPAKQN